MKIRTVSPHVRWTATCIATAALAASVLTACGGGTSDKTSGGNAGLTMGSPLSGTIDPIHADQEQTDNPDQLLYNTLVTYDQDSKLVPQLATQWSVGSDAKSITLTLRNGVKFHDGSPLTAADVVYTLDRVHTLNSGVATLMPSFASATAQGDNKVVVNLAKGDTTALGALSRIYILNSKLVKKHAGTDNGQGWLSSNEAGSGGYTLTSFTPNNQVVAKRWPGYWDFNAQRPTVFRMSYIQESTAAKNALLSNALDISQDLTASDAASMKGNSSFTLTPLKSPYEVYAALNTQAPALKDVRVRKAIALAFDYKGAFKQIFGGEGVIGAGPMPEYLSCRANLPESSQNVAEAKQLVQEAGATGLSVKIFYQPTLTQLTQAATLLASNLATIGIKAQLQTTTYPQYLQLLTKTSTTPDISMVYQNANIPDPGTFLMQGYDSQFVGRGSNLSQYSNPKVDQLIEAALVNPNEKSRCTQYEQAQKLIADDYVDLPIALGGVFVVARNNISGVESSPIHVYFDLMALRMK